jgi:hypothetical protein
MFHGSQCETCCVAMNEDITIVGAARTSCRREACQSQEEREKTSDWRHVYERLLE